MFRNVPVPNVSPPEAPGGAAQWRRYRRQRDGRSLSKDRPGLSHRAKCNHRTGCCSRRRSLHQAQHCTQRSNHQVTLLARRVSNNDIQYFLFVKILGHNTLFLVRGIRLDQVRIPAPHELLRHIGHQQVLCTYPKVRVQLPMPTHYKTAGLVDYRKLSYLPPAEEYLLKSA